MPTKPGLNALLDQAFAVTADGREHEPPFAVADAAMIAATLAEQFRGDEIIAGRAFMSAALAAGRLVRRYEDFPGGLDFVQAVLALAAEQLVREAGAS